MNPAVEAIPPSLIRAINARKRPGDIDLGLGEPTLRPDPAPFHAATEWVAAHGCPYTPNAGFTDLRELVSAYASDGVHEAAAHACITVGSEEALYLTIKALVDPARHEVLIVEPSYLAYAKLCVLEGVRYRSVALDAGEGFRPDAAAVLREVRPETRLVVVNTPSNPTGRVWPEAELRALAEGLRARGEGAPFVLSDEVYRELQYGAGRPPSIARLYDRTLVAGSLSKSHALTGLRLGWLVGPEREIAAAIKVHQFVNTAASTFSQRVALEIFAGGAMDTHRDAYQARRDAVLAAAASAGLRLLPPEGAFYAMAPLPPHLADDSVAAAERLLEAERVVTVPGAAFGESAAAWLRLSWVAPEDDIREGIHRIARFFAAE